MELEFHQLDLRYEALRVRRPSRERRLVVSLEIHGQQQPIIVVRHGESGDRYVVIDGYKRLRALRRLKQDTVLATLWDLSEAEALVLEHSLRTASGARRSSKDGCWRSLCATLAGAKRSWRDASSAARAGSHDIWLWCRICRCRSRSGSAAERSPHRRP